MVTGVLVVNIHKAASKCTPRSGGLPLTQKGHEQYNTALTALEKCKKNNNYKKKMKQKPQTSPLYNPWVTPEKKEI